MDTMPAMWRAMLQVAPSRTSVASHRAACWSRCDVPSLTNPAQEAGVCGHEAGVDYQCG